MSSKPQSGNKPADKAGAKAGAAKTGSKPAPKPPQAGKGGAKSNGAQSSNSGSGKASSSQSTKSSGAKPTIHAPKPVDAARKAQEAKKKRFQQEHAKYEASLASSSKKQADSYELYGDDISVEVVTGHSRDQVHGRRPRVRKPKTASAPNKRNIVNLSGAFQDRLLAILKQETWYNVKHMDYSTEPSIEENTDHLTKTLGFRRFEALQALQYAKNHYDIALEWLVINVPNEHLPVGFRSNTASAKIEIMDINSQSHLRKRSVRRLESYGFLKSQCQRELEFTNDDETQALYNLLESFLTRDAVSTMRRVRKATPMTEAYLEELKMMREDEFSMLESILGGEGEKATKTSDSLITMTIPLTLRASNNETKAIKLIFEVHFPPENHYPNELPLFGLTCEDLKSEVLYAFTRQIAIEANQFVGQQLIYPLIAWIHSTAPRTLASLSKSFDDPKKCADAHSKYTKTLREEDMEREALKQVKKEIRAQTSVAVSSATEAALGLDSGATESVVDLDAGFRLLNLDVREEKAAPKEKSESQKLRVATKSQELMEKLKLNRETNEQWKKMLKARSTLPAYQNRLKVLELLQGPKSQVVLISGATGCGKTTQIAQIILDDMIERGVGGECNIICTQPRRLSAVSVAERVAEERCESIGQSVGYSIRLEAQRSEETQVLFVTTGVLLRKLQNDPYLSDVSHVIVDEVHERDLNSDFLLIILKQVLAKRPDLQLILMSATLNADSFARYFDDCPAIEIPGRTFPVTQYLLEDVIEVTKYQLDARSPYAMGGRKYKLYDGYSVNTSNVMALLNRKKINYELITKLVEYIFHQYDNKVQGGILIFLPGMVEISTMIDHLSQSIYARKMTILPLHSTLSTEQQQRIFKKPAQGTRKVVVSTNIAETSVTVDDVVFVIDSCRVKEVRFDGHIESLVEDWASKAAMRQRMGRAGRVQAGFCWSLVAKDRHQYLPEFQDPEMLRVPLDSLVLQIRVLRLGNPRDFLKHALNPPTDLAIANAVLELQQLNAFDETEHLTPLGYHLGKLPVSPKIGKMLIYGAIFKCLSPILTICAALSDKPPFISSFENRDDAEDSKLSWDKDDEYSDQITIVKAFDAWEEFNATTKGSDISWCRENYLSKPTLINMRDLRKQFRQILKDSGFTHDAKKKFTSKEEKQKIRQGPGGDDMNSQDPKIIKAVLCAGLYPNIAHLRPRYDASGSITSTTIVTKDGEEVVIHPSSVLGKAKKFPGNFLVFHDRVLTSRLFLRDVTCIGNYAAILFGGKVEVFPEQQLIEIDDWLTLHTSGREGVLLSKMRQEIDKMLLAKVVDSRFDVSERKISALVVSVLKSEADMLVY
jgi:HrpA-like RNA helicase